MKHCKDDVLVLGAGLAGLSAGLALAKAGLGVKVIERGSEGSISPWTTAPRLFRATCR